MNVRSEGCAIVVGTSFAGLCAALTLAHGGWSVIVLERAKATSEGTGLAVDLELLAETTELPLDAVPVIRAGYSFTGWNLLHHALSAAAAAQASTEVRRGITVTDVHIDADGDGAMVHTTHDHLRAELVVGADGYNSVARRAVAPESPSAPYGGFLLWRGLINEHALPGGRLNGVDFDFDIEHADHGVLATFAIPGADGSVGPARRRGVFTWSGATHNNGLHTAGRIRAGHVSGIWHGPRSAPLARSAGADRATRSTRTVSPVRRAGGSSAASRTRVE